MKKKDENESLTMEMLKRNLRRRLGVIIVSLIFTIGLSGCGTFKCFLSKFKSNVLKYEQEDHDLDYISDACDPDDDNDGVLDGNDNCQFEYNPGREDLDGDKIGNICDHDADGDSHDSHEYGGDDCYDLDPLVWQGECLGVSGPQPNNNKKPPKDNDGDKVQAGDDSDDNNRYVCRDLDYDTCDDCSSGTDDTDNDGPDSDRDGLCDAGDTCPNDSENDKDGDNFCGDVDNCPDDANPNQKNTDCDLNNNCDQYGDACDDDADGDTHLKPNDCDDLDTNVYPGADELPDGKDNNCDGQVDEGFTAYYIDFSMSGYDNWLPDVIPTQAVVKVEVKPLGGAPDFTVDPPGITLTIDSTKSTNYAGKYTNDPNSAADDFTPTSLSPIGSGDTITLTCNDFGGMVFIHAEAWVTANSLKYLAQGDFTLPMDEDGDGLPDAWEKKLYNDLNTLISKTGNPDGDGLTNTEELRGFMWGPALSPVSGTLGGTYQTKAWVPQGDAKHFRTDPKTSDLFVKIRDYDFNVGNSDNGHEDPACDCPFALGNAFDEADVDVHVVSLDKPPGFTGSQGIEEWGKNISVAQISNNPGTYGATDGNINKKGIRAWNWDTKGWSGVGDEVTLTYGVGTRTYQKPLDNYFSQLPYRDDITLNGNSNQLDPVDSASVEDKNDNGTNEKIKGKWEAGCKIGCSLDGDLYELPVDYTKWNSGASDRHSAFDVDHDTRVELPFISDPSGPAAGTYQYEYTKAQVLKHTITHELGHSVGMDHNSDDSCLMYQYSNNWVRDHKFSNTAKQQMFIYNK